ncbi:radical SAM family heme chaperone HemW [Corynebacterium kroppenstedtii]|uniref:radical SAM family heme chaperone HemW n=1 Tax=Corynebacterium sp. PCR 32 TaxID=3351342 RepID=UPI003099F3B2
MPLRTARNDTFGVYVHVPFCVTRCGYCDFNTYTPGELGIPQRASLAVDAPRRSSASLSPSQRLSSPVLQYLDALERELARATERFRLPAADTVFIGGGTPSLLGADGLTRIVNAVRSSMGITPHAEVTTESNPESTSPEFFAALRKAGFTRVSLGMQSVSEKVLAVLDRRHTPGRPVTAAQEARAAGFDHVNLDLIYGTPGETDDDVRRSVDAVLEAGVDHVSAYSLIIERGTAMARKVRRGEVEETDEDTLARRYDLIDQRLTSDGLRWYEVSNWACPGGECRHNLVYWRDGDWWGAGPGAHGHLGDQRFVNVKHPARYAAMICQSDETLPLKDIENLTSEERHEERVMLALRLAEGMDVDHLSSSAAAKAEEFITDGLLWRPSPNRIAVTDRGRLLADGIITDILVSDDT